MRSRLTGILLAALFCLMPSLAQAQATLLSEYRFDDVAWCTPVSALDTVGGRNGSLISSVAWEDSPASGGKPVNGAAARFAGGAIDITGLPFDLAAGAKNSVSFWMFWDGTNSVMPIGFQSHDLWLQGGSFGFNTFNSDIFGISSAGLASGWHHVAAVFTNGNVAGNKIWIDGVPQVLTQRASTPNNGNAVVNAHMRISGVWGAGGYLFQGVLDAVRVYRGEMIQAQVDADRAASYAAVACPPPPAPVLLSEYRFDDVAWCTPLTALDTAGTRNGTLVGSVAWEDSPASGGKPVAGAAARFAGTGAIDITGVPFDLAAGGRNSVSFWMYWDGTNNVMPLGFGAYDLWLQGGSFGFNTFNSDIYGIASAGLASGWHHVAAVFTNGGVSGNKIWIDGVAQTLTQRASTPSAGNAVVSSHMRLSGAWGSAGYQFTGFMDGVRLYSGVITQAQVDADRAATYPAVVCPPPPPPTLVAHFRLDDNWDVTHAATNAVGGGPAATVLAPYATRVATPAVPPKPDTCFGARFTAATGSMRTTGVALDLNGGGKNSVSFWMLWNGGNNQMPFGFALHDLWLVGGNFGFNTASSDVFGIASAGLAGGWHHVAAVFTNGNVAANKLWIDGAPRALSQRQGAPNNVNAYAANTFQLSSWTNDNNYRFDGTLDELKAYRGALTDALVLADYAASCTSAVPGRFNAVEPGADPVTGSIRTKISGTSFPLDVVALNAAGTAIETGFNDNVKIELLGNATDITVPLDANGCPTTSTILHTIASQVLVNGRAASVSFPAVANAWRDVRVRTSWPVGAPTVVRCSADRFAIRPATVTAAARHNDWENAGDGADLMNGGTGGTPIHKAGRSFTLKGTGYNAVGVITTNYTSIPAFVAGSPTLVQPPAGVLGTFSLGAFSSAGGTVWSDTATYTEVGAVGAALEDRDFAQVDSGDGSPDWVIAWPVLTVGRFVPDHLALTAPTLTPACGTFTYFGQPGIRTGFTLTAQNAANGTTQNYAGVFARFDPTSYAAYNFSAATLPAGSTLSSAATAPAGSWAGGMLTLSTLPSHVISRPTAVTAPSNITLSAAPTDQDGVATVGAPVNLGATPLYFGRMRADNASGSELRALPLRVTAQFYNGTGFATNTLDNCTTLVPGNFILGNWQRNLNAGETALSGAGPWVSAGGVFSGLQLTAPGANNQGSVDVTVDLTAASWLQTGPAFNVNPAARATFGIFRDSAIYRREVFW